MSLIQVGLVDTTGSLDPELVQAAAAALNVQVMRDLPQYWDIQATVLYLPNARQIPPGVWPVQLVKSLPPGEGGFHLDKHKQPFAKVIASTSSEDWTVDASHETIEMLVDPFGNRLQSSRGIEIKDKKIQDGPGEFQYLVEACDPCEADEFAYSIQGVAVSDFLTPHFYDPVVASGTRYSFTDAIKAPRQILPGGYISFVNPEAGEVQQILWVDPNSPPVLNDLGPVPENMCLREWVDGQTSVPTREYRRRNPRLLAACKERRSHIRSAALKRGELYAIK
jgi:hypothetical protein